MRGDPLALSGLVVSPSDSYTSKLPHVGPELLDCLITLALRTCAVISSMSLPDPRVFFFFN